MPGKACLKRWNGWISNRREMMSLAAMASVPWLNWLRALRSD